MAPNINHLIATAIDTRNGYCWSLVTRSSRRTANAYTMYEHTVRRGETGRTALSVQSAAPASMCVCLLSALLMVSLMFLFCLESLVCLLCLVDLCRRRYVSSCNDLVCSNWPSWFGQVLVRVSYLSFGSGMRVLAIRQLHKSSLGRKSCSRHQLNEHLSYNRGVAGPKMATGSNNLKSCKQPVSFLAL